MKKTLFGITFAALFLSGCAMNVKHQYSHVDFNVNPKLSPLKVAVQDHRRYIVSGEKENNFVGLSRGGFGNPFDVTTASGKPFAEDVGSSIRAAFEARGGAKVDTSVVPSNLDESEAIAASKHATQKTLLLIFNEWKADTYMHTNLHYDFNAYVIGPTGNVLGVRKFSGSNNSEAALFNPPGASKKATPNIFRQKMEELFSSPEIVNQL